MNNTAIHYWYVKKWEKKRCGTYRIHGKPKKINRTQ